MQNNLLELLDRQCPKSGTIEDRLYWTKVVLKKRIDYTLKKESLFSAVMDCCRAWHSIDAISKLPNKTKTSNKDRSSFHIVGLC